MNSDESARLGRITVELSNTGKTFFPDDELTKGDLIGYYQAVAGRMLPHLRDRPLALARYPDGITGQRFIQKNVPDYFPDWVSRAEVAKQDGTVCHAVADNAATIVYLANQGCLELHAFLSRVDALDLPDQLILDLDPPGIEEFADARRAALATRTLLEDDLGLTSFVRTTGGNGLHVHVPLAARADFDEVRGFTRQVAEVLAAREPDLLTVEQRKNKRDGKVYADVMRNAYAQTAVAPYSVRARPGAPVSAPLHWDEVSDRALTPCRFTMATMAARLDEHDDIWSGYGRRRQNLTDAAKRLADVKGPREESGERPSGE